MTLKDLDTPVPGRVGGSSLAILALRGDTATGQIEVAEIHDNSLAVGDIPATAVRRMVAATDFRPWPQRTVHIEGQPFVYQWTGGRSSCAKCGAELEHFAYVGRPGGDVREHAQGSAQRIWYCEGCARDPLDIAAL